ncbi:MAG: thrombospondin type 3 repeat-containing protein [Verrucomicrobiota bacterium]|nr:thrombospondin type 3 repeat-containing protein [Verrucomicrobiota bacterium]
MALKLNADNPIARHYDKLIVVVVLIGLVISLFYLTSAAGPARNREEENYKRQLENLKPASANLEAISMSEFQGAEKLARDPLQLERPDPKQAGFLAPECRVVCVAKGCKKLIPFEAVVCPFCGGKQPTAGAVDDFLDSDKDGIPDQVEIAWGLNPNDPADAAGDLDGDGFTNLEEYLARTDPKDPKSHPELITRLRVKELRGKRLPVQFSSVNKMPDGKYQLTFNQLEPERRTFWIREGEKIGETGYAAGTLTVKIEERENPTMPGIKQRVDVSTVIVKRLSDNKEWSLLVNDRNVKVTDVEAIIVLTLDATEYTVVEGAALKVRDETYRVLSVDSVKTTVTIENEATGQQKVIPKLD